MMMKELHMYGYMKVLAYIYCFYLDKIFEFEFPGL